VNSRPAPDRPMSTDGFTCRRHQTCFHAGGVWEHEPSSHHLMECQTQAADARCHSAHWHAASARPPLAACCEGELLCRKVGLGRVWGGWGGGERGCRECAGACSGLT